MNRKKFVLPAVHLKTERALRDGCATHNWWHCSIGIFSGLLLVVVPTLSASAADPEFIADFMKREAEWEKLINVTISVEGRYASISAKRLSLQKCDLTFRSIKPLVKPTDSDSVEVVGHLIKEGDRYVFVVSRIGDLPSELFRYERKLTKIDQRKPEDWHELALWLKQRGDFYKDASLIQKSKEAFASELEADLKIVNPDDLKGRLKLADKVTRLGLAESQREEIIHDAYVEQWKLISAEIEPDADGNSKSSPRVRKRLQELIEQMARDLPGSNEPLTPPQPELFKSYLAAPVKTYLKADKQQRRKLHRVLFAEALQTSIVQEAKFDRTRGYASASKIEKQLPEFISLAEQLRIDQLAWERSQLTTYSRRQVLELAERYKERKQPEEAKTVLVEWLDNRREKLRTDDAGEHVRLAEEYVNLVGDEAQAAELLIAAYKLTPEVAEISERLTQLGLVLKNKDWIRTKDMNDPVQQRLERAIREGRVEVGMTRKQIHRSLGAPTLVSRVRSLRSVDEVWMYRLGASTMLAIQFGQMGRNDGPVARSINEVSQADFTFVAPPKPIEKNDAASKSDDTKE
ncbi:MAG: hypothetical protein O2955_09340 [Planctomycetota bacterium]|nr:hypothetical protein [Planctomycetota bacterium]MDA1212712.1 hypothetical protein [Planctomycetota bacterium]